MKRFLPLLLVLALVAAAAGSQVVDIVAEVETSQDLERLLRSGQIAVGIVIPRDFDRRIQFGERPPAQLLVDVQGALYQRALDFRQNNTHRVDSYDEFKERLESESGFFLAHWDGTPETEAQIKAETKATIRVIPLDQEPEDGVDLVSGHVVDLDAQVADLAGRIRAVGLGHRHRPVRFGRIEIAAGERLNVAVEDHPHEFPAAVDHRAARITSLRIDCVA